MWNTDLIVISVTIDQISQKFATDFKLWAFTQNISQVARLFLDYAKQSLEPDLVHTYPATKPPTQKFQKACLFLNFIFLSYS